MAPASLNSGVSTVSSLPLPADESPRHYLVTGGAGFLGINLVRCLPARGHSVTSLDVAPFDYDDCRSRIREVRGAIRDIGAVREATDEIAASPLYVEDLCEVIYLCCTLAPTTSCRPGL